MPDTMDGSDLRVDAPVIIVGGGPVGLSLALGLARYGARSIVLERSLEPVAESRAVVIWPRTQEILRDWGVYEAIRGPASFVTTLNVANALTGASLLAIDFSVIADVAEEPGAIILPQYETERILRDLVARNPHCELRTGVTVERLLQDTAFVDVTCSDGTTLRASYAVGCDGAHGVVRRNLGLSLEGITYDTRVVLSDEVLESDRSDPGITARVRVDRPGMRGAIRFAPNTWRVIATVDRDLDDDAALSEPAHAQRLREIFGDCVSTRTAWSSLFKIHRRHAQRFIVGRVMLAGDAAHLNSPAGGQGMNAGIHDAANLAWKLAIAARTGAPCDALLETYDVERREMLTDTVERITDRFTRVGIGIPPRARQLVIRAVSRAIRARGMQRKACRALGMLSGRYTKSPIIDARHPLAGRRVDDLLLSNGARINAHRAGEAILIVAGELALDLPHVRIPVPPKRWHVKPPVVVIVRPDGCVAAVVEKPDEQRIARAWEMAFCGMLPLPSHERG
jgi:2-polyprenyl-6-methoxyphenol hydroxylase-like FAD-dependent oxidoreductase